jgi:catalase
LAKGQYSWVKYHFKTEQGRLSSYHDTHLRCLGTNYHLLPVNRPKAASLNYQQRDGFVAPGDEGGNAANSLKDR